jgi:hypothetical protein
MKTSVRKMGREAATVATAGMLKLMTALPYSCHPQVQFRFLNSHDPCEFALFYEDKQILIYSIITGALCAYKL